MTTTTTIYYNYDYDYCYNYCYYDYYYYDYDYNYDCYYYDYYYYNYCYYWSLWLLSLSLWHPSMSHHVATWFSDSLDMVAGGGQPPCQCRAHGAPPCR